LLKIFIEQYVISYFKKNYMSRYFLDSMSILNKNSPKTDMYNDFELIFESAESQTSSKINQLKSILKTFIS
jgi:hypothetical protein